ncbi:MAG: TRAP transporter small permease [Alphaproteobacteria bacterium]
MIAPREAAEPAAEEIPRHGLPGRAAAFLAMVNGAAAAAGAIAFGIAGCVLTWEATARYFFHIPSDWQDELAVILLVGGTFMSAAWVQERRGHVGIQALAAILPAAADRCRRFASDVVALLFCAFFCWKSWTLWLEAWQEDRTSDSAWGAPLWIPYGCMALGMTLLAMQYLLQVLSRAALAKAPVR